MIVLLTFQKKATTIFAIENRLDQDRKRLTTCKEGRHLVQLMTKDRRQTSRQLGFEWSSSNGKIVSPLTVRRRLFNAGNKSYAAKRKPYLKLHHYYTRLIFARHYYK